MIVVDGDAASRGQARADGKLRVRAGAAAGTGRTGLVLRVRRLSAGAADDAGARRRAVLEGQRVAGEERFRRSRYWRRHCAHVRLP